jgi:pimeloyl-ACP methyl ester carboxylesterase
MYRGGRPNPVAGILGRATATLASAGLSPRRLVTLEVPGRRSGQLISLPVVVADHQGERYLVAMLGRRATGFGMWKPPEGPACSDTAAGRRSLWSWSSRTPERPSCAATWSRRQAPARTCRSISERPWPSLSESPPSIPCSASPPDHSPANVENPREPERSLAVDRDAIEAVHGVDACRVVMMRHLGKTPPFRGPHGELLPGSIAEVSYRQFGGLDQWVMIRGESVANPPLILLHGGPGFSETGFFRCFNAPLEKSFTAVYWDQRGAGKSFDRSIPRSSMTTEQFISDLNELVDAVCQRLDMPKVAIFGHSWGSVLGVLYAARFPERVAAYVGCGQIGDWAAAESGSYDWALGEAQRRSNRRALRKLQAIGPPPYTAAAVFTERTWVARFEGQMRPRALWKVARAVVGGQESSIFELPSGWRGFRWSMDAMWAEVSRLNLMELAPKLQMPVFFFLGREDHFVPPETSVAYFDALAAPSKKLVWFEDSRHEPFVDEPDKFNAAMVESLRLALAGVHTHART